ncbi:DUF3566 domain-containing protein [Sphaerisporangium fuscum]|uniref:DUF3566 domain-containing protein n=1 Tax=Sphaerisporangium fuscum TaxID=2835868 RepID=UPI0027E2E1FA|nr:DUF3566 domain-containing protein [Sphaerisporangium fuscum]
MSTEDGSAAPAGDGESGDATLRIRSSGVPDKSWSPSDGQGGGPARAAKPSAATPPPASASQANAPRPGGPGTAPKPGPGGPRPASSPAAGASQGALGGLASPEPVAGRSGQRDKPAAAKAPRKAHLVLRRVEPWSAMKFSFVVSLVCFVVLFVAVAVLYGVLSALGVFDSIVNTVTQLTVPDGKTTSGLDIKSWFEPVRILGYTALLGAVNVVLITALSTLGAVIYNVASDLVGGVEVTFSEAE